jgi:hypothetical protein
MTALPIYISPTCDLEVRGHCMCKEMPIISANRVVDWKRRIGKKMEGRGGGKAQGVATPPPPKKKNTSSICDVTFQSGQCWPKNYAFQDHTSATPEASRHPHIGQIYASHGGGGVTQPVRRSRSHHSLFDGDVMDFFHLKNNPALEGTIFRKVCQYLGSRLLHTCYTWNRLDRLRC